VSFAVAGNLIVLVVTSLTVGWFGPLSLVPVVLVSTLAGIGAAVTYSLLEWRLGDPDRIFLAVAATVLLVSFVSLDFAVTIDGATVPRLIVLGITHVVAAVGCVTALTDIGR
jgi:hypothetical protein